MTDKQLIERTLAATKNTRTAAEILGYSQRTLIRRMRALNITSRSVGRPRVVHVFTSAEEHETLIGNDFTYWEKQSVKRRIEAVGIIREAAAKLYEFKIPERLERICRPIGEASRALFDRRRTRTRSHGATSIHR